MRHLELGRLLLVTGSTEEPLTLAEAKSWLKIEEEETADDGPVSQLIATARQRYEAYTRRILMRQAFDYYLDETPCEDIRPPCYPLVSVTSIKGFTDTDATDTGGTSMSSSEYYVDVASEPGRIAPFAGFTFPVATRVVNACIVRLTAGYSTSSTGIPADAKTTLGKMIARASEFRGDQSEADQNAIMDECLHDEFSLPEWG